MYLERSVLIPKQIRELNIRIDNNKEGKVWYDDVKIIKGNTSKTIVIEESNYYPFGLEHKGYNNVTSSNGNSTAQKFGYNGKELEESLGYNMLEYGARNYDPTIGRYFNIDNYNELYHDMNPYQYTSNNPVKFIDVNGDYIYIYMFTVQEGKVTDIQMVNYKKRKMVSGLNIMLRQEVMNQIFYLI